MVHWRVAIAGGVWWPPDTGVSQLGCRYKSDVDSHKWWEQRRREN